MDSHNHLINDLEARLLSIVETKSVDLTCDGEVILERMSSPLSEERKELNYYLHTHSEGVIVGQVKLIDSDHLVKVEAELNIKKFIKPQLSLSSAHVAVLIHSLKSLIQRVKLQSTDGETLSWKLDRVQRKVKLEKQVDLSLESSIWLIRQLARIITKVSQLSLEVIQEEAEYYKAIERWPYARRAYLSWHSLSTLSFNNLQEFLMILQNLKDWRACLNLLEESIDRYDEQIGAKLAFAASVLCKDVLLESAHAVELAEKALVLDAENDQYKSHYELCTTAFSLQDNNDSNVNSEDDTATYNSDHSVNRSDDKQTTGYGQGPLTYDQEDELDLDLPDVQLSIEERDDDFDPFFDEQSMTSDQLKPIVDDAPLIEEAPRTEEPTELSEEELTQKADNNSKPKERKASQVTHKSKRSRNKKSKSKKKSKKKSGKKK